MTSNTYSHNIHSIVFVSNFLSPHQKPLCDEFYSRLGNNFVFVANQPINTERLQLGYFDLNETEYVLKAYESKKKLLEAYKIVRNADVVIIGSASDKYIKKRLKQGKITFKYSERILKEALTIRRLPRFVIGTWLHHGRFMKFPLYMLCASAFESSDLHKLGFYKNRCYKWGYFPETRIYEDIGSVLREKKSNSILWTGRFIDWKHPEYCIEIAKRLVLDGYCFNMTIIGAGNMRDWLYQEIKRNQLSTYVRLLDAMTPSQIREYMEQSSVFLATSNRKEGWGAVINEAMNSACMVIASSMMGATPYLIRDNQNGLIFKNEDIDDLYKKVVYALNNEAVIRRCGQEAYFTITRQWNSCVAVDNFLSLVEQFRNPEHQYVYSENAPCSYAEILTDDWFEER